MDASQRTPIPPNWVPLRTEMQKTWGRDFMEFWPQTEPDRIPYPPEFGSLVHAIAIKRFLSISTCPQEDSQGLCDPEERSFRRAQIFYPLCIQALKDLFESSAFQYVQTVCSDPYFSGKLQQCYPDLFAQLPGSPDNALRNTSMLHQRIRFGEAIKDAFKPVAFQYLQKLVTHTFFSKELRLHCPDLLAQLPRTPDDALGSVSALHLQIEGIEATRGLFQPTAFQYLKILVADPKLSKELQRCYPDLFAQLPGEPDNALRNVSLLHQRIDEGDLMNDPKIRAVLSSFKDALQAIVDRAEEDLFPRPDEGSYLSLCHLGMVVVASLIAVTSTVVFQNTQ